MILTYIAGGVGVAVAFYYLGSDSKRALTAVTIAYVVIGLVSWVRHVLVWQEDAKRLDAAGQATPFFQWETGFANGAFAVAGLMAVVFDWGVAAMAVAVLGYALKYTLGLRPSAEDEQSGLDITGHGEVGYHLSDFS